MEHGERRPVAWEVAYVKAAMIAPDAMFSERW
jgi:hypothetical protein